MNSTSATSLSASLTPANVQDKQSLWPSIANPSLSILYAAPTADGWQKPLLDLSVAESFLCHAQDGCSGSTSGQGTSTWLTNLDVSSPTHVQSMSSYASPHGTFRGAVAAVIPASMQTPELLHLQKLPHTSSGYPSLLTTGQHSAPCTNDNITARSSPECRSSSHQLPPATFLAGNFVPLSSPGSIEHAAYLAHNRSQAPIVNHLPPDRMTLNRRRSKPARAINVEGIVIDMDDLNLGALQADGTISVHQCQWTISSNPCGMWIIGSRSHVGAHIRKWHNERKTTKTTHCLWDECTTRRAMLKDSLNRHIVTVHLGEGFLCRGCNQTYPRKDVYESHVKNGEVCKGAGVAVVYNTGRGMIDARRALQ